MVITSKENESRNALLLNGTQVTNEDVRLNLAKDGKLDGWSKPISSKADARTSELIVAHDGIEGSRTTSALAISHEPPTPWEGRWGGRYEDRGLIGRGGMGEVRRVFDRNMNRCVALKVLPWNLSDKASARLRFLREAHVTASLDHPGVIPIYDRGVLADGRPWYTMREVQGITLSSVIRSMYAGGERRWTLRRVLRVFHRMCETVAYAHSKGIVHRDLKPDNLMVGQFGEVLVLDWGLAKRASKDTGHIALQSHTTPPPIDSCLTNLGTVVGTPGYIAPEHYRGTTGSQPTSDVYSLGVILFEIVTGCLPLDDDLQDVDVAAGPPSSSAKEELLTLARSALVRDVGQRIQEVERFAQQLLAWVERERRAEEVQRLILDAERMAETWRRGYAEAQALRVEGQRRLSRVHTYERQRKVPIWDLLNTAEHLERAAALAEVQWAQHLRAALNVDPDAGEVHGRLADHYAERLLEAERSHQSLEIARYESLLKIHDRGRHSALLSGLVRVTMDTRPSGVRVDWFRYEEHERRLRPVPLEITPPHPLELRAGSYLLKLSAPGYETVTRPALLERSRSCTDLSIELPERGQLEVDHVYVSAGWFRCGGDPLAVEALPGQDVWVDSFAIQRFPVTHGQYLVFLNALVADGRSELALKHAPCLPVSRIGWEQITPAYERRKDGLFELAPPTPALPWAEDQPVTLITWYDAMAYARWYSEQRGHRWRLPNELEWEKAARGVDGRLASWGNHLEPTYAAMIGSHSGTPSPLSVYSYPEDCSPYGVRGMTGNVKDWCCNVWKWDGPVNSERRLNIDEATREEDGLRSVRGGCWTSAPDQCRAAGRFAMPPSSRLLTVGFRLARDFIQSTTS
jgi:formylglycine-generating enzyme required for sulfatase activity/tRNA A-37 threonylcarbamoyl transferase component Bud32